VDPQVDQEQRDGAFSGYAAPETQPPFGSYGALAALFNAGFAALLVEANRSGRLPERIEAGDIVLVGTASHKLSRLITKDRVTTFLRAPFTEYQGSGAPGEVEEKPRGRGARRAIGQLLVCPYCIGLWVVAGLNAGLVFAPRPTRLVAATFTGLTISDFLQIAYKAAEEKGLGG
jgi:uncharacterized protein DUF1360